MTGDGDLTAILSSGDFDSAAVFTVTGGTVSTRGIFTDATQQVNPLSGELEVNNPSIACETSTVTSVKRGNTVVINAVTYTVERIERLGIGLSLIHLKT